MKKIFFIAIVGAILASCGNYDTTAQGISSGELKIGVDESYSLMMQSQIPVYEQVYAKAKIKPTYSTEEEIIRLLLADSIQAAIINRPLNQAELDFFASKQRLPESVKIATDAIALIIHQENQDSVLTLDQAKQVLSGQITNWSQINSSNKNGDIRIIFDHNGSCNARYVQENFLNRGAMPANFFAMDSTAAVINYPGAIGIISVSWITDPEDKVTKAFRDKIDVVGILNNTLTDHPERVRYPFQAYVFDKSYPFTRDVFAIRTGLKGTVGTGFISFLNGEKGQLIIHKMGMVAATSPTRIIRIKD
jgi:phosphate transport system substrate-binding protein